MGWIENARRKAPHPEQGPIGRAEGRSGDAAKPQSIAADLDAPVLFSRHLRGSIPDLLDAILGLLSLFS